MEALPRIFDMLQYFETILPSVESLSSSQQDEDEWWRCWRPVTSATMVATLTPSWMLPRIRNQIKTGINGDFFVLDMKNNT